MPCYRVAPMLLTVLLGSLLLGGHRTEGAAQNRCINRCGKARKQCIRIETAHFKRLKAACTGTKQQRMGCKTAAQALFKQRKLMCTAFGKTECPTCCRSGGANCDTRCGDERVDPGEECDPPAVGSCQPGVPCGADCRCAGSTLTTTTTTTPTTSPPTTTLPSPCGNDLLEPGEACDPPGSSAQCPGGRCGATCTCEFPTLPFVQWAPPPPGEVSGTAAFPLALQVTTTGRTCTGDAAAVRGSISVCPEGAPRESCGTAPLDIIPPAGAFAGAPQTFTFTAHRNDQCPDSAAYDIAPQLYLRDHLGAFTVGPFIGPTARTRFRNSPVLVAGTGSQSETQELIFNALAGVPTPPGAIGLSTVCGEAFSWTSTADAPWIHVTPSSGTAAAGDTATPEVAVDVRGLAAAAGPFQGTVTIGTPGFSQLPILIPVTLNVYTGMSVQLANPLPGAITPGEPLQLTLYVTGNFSYAQGRLSADWADPTRAVYDEPPLSIGPDEGEFSGAPGRFDFTLYRPRGCGGAGAVRVSAYVYGDTGFGEPDFIVDLGVIQLSPTAAVPISPMFLGPDDYEQVKLNALPGQVPVPQDVELVVGCDPHAAWTAAVDQPWAHVTPAGGSASDTATVTVSVDPTGLSPSTAPYQTMLHITPQGSPDDRLDLPVVFNLRNDVVIGWLNQPPPSFASGDSFVLDLSVRGNATEFNGEVLGCPTTVTPADCIRFYQSYFSTFFDGPPGVFHLSFDRGRDCLGPDSVYFIARVSYGAGPLYVGPFLSAPTQTTVVPPSSSPALTVARTLTFNAFGHQAPLPQTLQVYGRCGAEPGPWTVTLSATWLHVTPVGATHVEVTVDLTGLDPAQAPYQAKITISSPVEKTTEVPVLLNLAC